MAGNVVVQPDEAIDEVMNLAVEAEASGETAYPGKTYEEGVVDMGHWLMGRMPDPPLP